jgi:RHS repeat-associated protein
MSPRSSNNEPRVASSQASQVAAPSLTLPKGGGAIRGIGEKFSANPVTGSASLTVPIYVSSGRSGFGPQLSISYDYGSGNSPFGFGWSLALPAVTRKTEKGLPLYRDARESDTFILSGVEDLVPSLTQAAGQWTRDFTPARSVYGNQYEIHRYRPRVESLFARIERWINRSDPQDTFWRSISKDNITSWYGKSSESRIFDPVDPSHVFSWLICESYDDKGNAISYRYKAEDSAGVDLTQAHERNRSVVTRSVQRYLKHIFYGNRTPYFPDLTQPAPFALPSDWLFQVVLDFGEHDTMNPTPQETQKWNLRPDPFSTYRPTFEARTYRLCRRVLMFHHFEQEPNVGLNCLVRSTDFLFSSPPLDSTKAAYSYLLSATQTGYRRDGAGGYISNFLPPLEFEYTDASVDETVREVDPESLENLPFGLDGSEYRWVDLDGEGLHGILTEQNGSWLYKANLSPINQQTVKGAELTQPRFAPVEVVARQPSLAALNASRQQLLDLSGDGQLDLVDFDRPTPGFFERNDDAAWEPFQTFESLPDLDWGNPNLKFVDVTGDGLPDLLISEDNALCWHTSLGAEGFGPQHRIAQSLDEEKGPKLVFSDGTQSIFLTDMSGDGLTDLVRIRNGEVCYWPNLGYGRFGAKVIMDRSPWFDRPDIFDGRRIQLADIDGSGTSDIIYFAGRRVDLYFNQSGNGYGSGRTLSHFPAVESLSSATAVDLLGNGTACLVWSSPLPGSARQPMRYVDLMGGQKPHLLARVRNNLGAETLIQYAPSTKFYVADKIAGTPWVTRIPFPVQVVEQTQTFDYISRNLFVTRFAYHHGYFDGVEREFRGFARVDQWDTEEFASLSSSGDFPQAVNLDAASSVPPMWTRTWYHTGAFFGESRISKYLEQEYYSEGDSSSDLAGLTTAQFDAILLKDTILPATVLRPDGSRIAYAFSSEEMREACRALRGSVLRQEVYALDDTDESDRPYSVAERNYTIEALQPRGPNRYGVFLVHPRETLDFHYERKLYKVMGNTLADSNAPPPAKSAADPQVIHSVVLEVDSFGKVLQSVSVGYGRRYLDPALTAADQLKQSSLLSTYSDSLYTNALSADDAYRTPLPAQTTSYELIQIKPSANLADITNLFGFDELQTAIQSAADGSHDIPFENPVPAGLNVGQPYRRLIECTRTLYRPNDLGAAAGNPRAPLPLGKLESLALPAIGYKLALTSGLIAKVFKRAGTALLPAPAAILESVGADGGGYVDLDVDGRFWIPSGQIFYTPSPPSSPAEWNEARQNFFLPRRFEDPFGNATTIDYDKPYDLLAIQATNAGGNTSAASNDYRVLAPTQITDPNGNQVKVSFDALGLVVTTAVMGKPGENLGDLPSGFSADLVPAETDALYNASDPRTLAPALLGNATSRVVYDVNRFFTTRMGAPGDPSKWLPGFAATIVREKHLSDLAPGQQSKLHVNFSYSDGFGREIQSKIQAEPGPIVDKGPVVPIRWVGTGWTIFNNKGKPVRQYEPFFSQLPLGHQFEFGNPVGVSPILCYDPIGRVVATIHPNHTYEKVVFDPWWQASWDVNDMVLLNDPTTDPDVGDFFKRLPPADFTPTWAAQRIAGPSGPEQDAATKAAAHANTPSLGYLDVLGRAFLTIADNAGAGKYTTRVEFDILSNRRSMTDTLGRVSMVYEYGLLSQRLHQFSMEAGQRWLLDDAAGKKIRGWDSRGHNIRQEYDQLRRPLQTFVIGTDAANSDSRTIGGELLVEKIAYGEGQPNDQALNLRTRIFQHFDSAGMIQNMIADPPTKKTIAFDFKGNLLGSSRQFVQDYAALPDWSKPMPALLAGVFVSTMQYDALNRMVAARAPDGSVLHPAYNEANLLESMDVNLLGAATATSFVSNIDYNAKGQRVLIEYGPKGAPSASTSYSYDPLTFRLSNVITTRPNVAPAEQLAQNLSYTYDPSGNITHIQDTAQQTIYFNNRIVEPSADYTYDAVYRLTRAKGREQLGLNAAANKPLPPWPTSYNDVPRIHLPHPGDGRAMGTYVEQYSYDDTGNFLSVNHAGDNPVDPGWSRSYTYHEASLIEAGKFSNGLTSSALSGSVVWNEPYTYDPHGNMTSMPQVQSMQWDFRDQLLMTRRQAVNGGDSDGILHRAELTFYVYNGAGQRVRKTTESASGVKSRERLYVGPLEVYREYDSSGKTTLERQTLHVTDDQRRIALVETATGGTSAIRFQFDNHLGTACLELDDTGAIISYEEYYPFGSTSYQAGPSFAEVSLKRYRYAGKERDEETGLYYVAARYCASWLGRWTSCDPSGTVDSVNLYLYARCNPIRLVDRSGRQSTPAPASGASPPQPPPPSTPPLAQVTVNRAKGLAAADALKAQVESKGHGVQSEVTVKGGRGGSRIDIAPDPRAPQTIAKTLESKHIDLNNYRTNSGALDLPRLREAVQGDVRQVLKHQQALARGVKPDLPKRESLVYTLENAKAGEAAQVQSLFRGQATPRNVKGGVLQEANGGLATSSGRQLSGGTPTPAATAPPPAPAPPPPASPPPAAKPAAPAVETADAPALITNELKDEAKATLGADIRAETGVATRSEAGLLARAGGAEVGVTTGLIVISIYFAYEDYKEGAKNSSGEGILNAAGTLAGGPGYGTMLRQAGELGSAVHDPGKLWDAITSGTASPSSIGLGIIFGSF